MEKALRAWRVVVGAVPLALASVLALSGPGAASVRGDVPDRIAAHARAAAVVQPFANRVVTFNVGNPLDPEPAEIAAEIAEYRPQVAALQEICVRQTNEVRDILARTYGLKYDVAHGSVLDSFVRCGGTPLVDPGAFGNAILSAAPLTDKLVDEYPGGGSEDRGYVAATTRVDGEPVRVFATHFAEAEQRDVRAKQARYLADRASGFDRSIVLGDLNATPDAPELAPLWKFFRDADPSCGPRADGGRCQATHPGVNKKFDYILLRKGAYQPRGVGSHDNYSDHNLVHADVS